MITNPDKYPRMRRQFVIPDPAGGIAGTDGDDASAAGAGGGYAPLTGADSVWDDSGNVSGKIGAHGTHRAGTVTTAHPTPDSILDDDFRTSRRVLYRSPVTGKKGKAAGRGVANSMFTSSGGAAVAGSGGNGMGIIRDEYESARDRIRVSLDATSKGGGISAKAGDDGDEEGKEWMFVGPADLDFGPVGDPPDTSVLKTMLTERAISRGNTKGGASASPGGGTAADSGGGSVSDAGASFKPTPQIVAAPSASDMIATAACALCGVIFSKKALKFRTTAKRVHDQRQRWAVTIRKAEDAAIRQARRNGAVIGPSSPTLSSMEAADKSPRGVPGAHSAFDDEQRQKAQRKLSSSGGFSGSSKANPHYANPTENTNAAQILSLTNASNSNIIQPAARRGGGGFGPEDSGLASRSPSEGALSRRPSTDRGGFGGDHHHQTPSTYHNNNTNSNANNFNNNAINERDGGGGSAATSKLAASHMYSDVSVCAFCAQFCDQHETSRGATAVAAVNQQMVRDTRHLAANTRARVQQTKAEAKAAAEAHERRRERFLATGHYGDSSDSAAEDDEERYGDEEGPYASVISDGEQASASVNVPAMKATTAPTTATNGLLTAPAGPFAGAPGGEEDGSSREASPNRSRSSSRGEPLRKRSGRRSSAAGHNKSTNSLNKRPDTSAYRLNVGSGSGRAVRSRSSSRGPRAAGLVAVAVPMAATEESFGVDAPDAQSALDAILHRMVHVSRDPNAAAPSADSEGLRYRSAFADGGAEEEEVEEFSDEEEGDWEAEEQGEEEEQKSEGKAAAALLSPAYTTPASSTQHTPSQASARVGAAQKQKGGLSDAAHGASNTNTNTYGNDAFESDDELSSARSPRATVAQSSSLSAAPATPPATPASHQQLSQGGPQTQANDNKAPAPTIVVSALPKQQSQTVAMMGSTTSAGSSAAARRFADEANAGSPPTPAASPIRGAAATTTVADASSHQSATAADPYAANTPHHQRMPKHQRALLESSIGRSGGRRGEEDDVHGAEAAERVRWQLKKNRMIAEVMAELRGRGGIVGGLGGTRDGSRLGNSAAHDSYNASQRPQSPSHGNAPRTWSPAGKRIANNGNGGEYTFTPRRYSPSAAPAMAHVKSSGYGTAAYDPFAASHAPRRFRSAAAAAAHFDPSRVSSGNGSAADASLTPRGGSHHAGPHHHGGYPLRLDGGSATSPTKRRHPNDGTHLYTPKRQFIMNRTTGGSSNNRTVAAIISARGKGGEEEASATRGGRAVHPFLQRTGAAAREQYMDFKGVNPVVFGADGGMRRGGALAAPSSRRTSPSTTPRPRPRSVSPYGGTASHQTSPRKGRPQSASAAGRGLRGGNVNVKTMDGGASNDSSQLLQFFDASVASANAILSSSARSPPARRGGGNASQSPSPSRSVSPSTAQRLKAMEEEQRAAEEAAAAAGRRRKAARKAPPPPPPAPEPSPASPLPLSSGIPKPKKFVPRNTRGTVSTDDGGYQFKF